MVSSMAHAMAPPTGIQFAQINDPASYTEWHAYGQSKLANILHARSLAARMADRRVYVNSVHPGAVNTELTRNFGTQYGAVVQRVLDVVEEWLYLSVEDGALTQLFVATSPQIELRDLRGRYFVPLGKVHSYALLEPAFFQIHSHAVPVYGLLVLFACET
jgi:NAD(P)-dependent dehydrogenase (short-subunit alcohol dehydrogenase family)